jgi:hypothetical protein
VNWLKTYDLKGKGMHFRVYISEDGGLFHAACLWHTPRRALKAPGEAGAMSISLQRTCETTEQGALQQILEWAKKKFQEPLALTPA